jgi:hypothetical protein
MCILSTPRFWSETIKPSSLSIDRPDLSPHQKWLKHRMTWLSSARTSPFVKRAAGGKRNENNGNQRNPHSRLASFAIIFTTFFSLTSQCT